MKARDRDFFQRLSHIQRPGFLWIGCSDSRVPANEIIGLLPGELFVHRNIANIVCADDLNCRSVIEYAIEVLGIRHIIVCGHYNCGGVRAVIEKNSSGIIHKWLRPVRNILKEHAAEIGDIRQKHKKINRLCELNVLQQALNVYRSEAVKRSSKIGRHITVHAWIYDLKDGLIKNCANIPR